MDKENQEEINFEVEYNIDKPIFHLETIKEVSYEKPYSN